MSSTMIDASVMRGVLRLSYPLHQLLLLLLQLLGGRGWRCMIGSALPAPHHLHRHGQCNSRLTCLHSICMLTLCTIRVTCCSINTHVTGPCMAQSRCSHKHRAQQLLLPLLEIRIPSLVSAVACVTLSGLRVCD